MSEDLHKIELIESYIRGELSGKELSDFEERLLVEPDLQEEVNIFKDILSKTKLHNKQLLKKEINDLHSNLKKEGFFEKLSSPQSKITNMKNTENSNNKFSIRKVLGIAATIALLLTAGYFIINQKTNTEFLDNEILAKIKEPENVQIIVILDDLSSKGMAARDNPETDSLGIGLRFYETFKYKEARAFFFNFLEKYPDNHTARLYFGLSLVQLSKYAKASQHLQMLTPIKDFKQRDIAEWYLALCYLTFNTSKEKGYAIKILQNLAKNYESTYQKEAVVMLELLGYPVNQ